MTCKDCVHYEVCYLIEHYGADIEGVEDCIHFKPKSRFVELPCEVGQTVYSDICGKITPYCVVGIICSIFSMIGFSLENNGAAYVFVTLALIYCVFNLIDKAQENKNGRNE